MLCELRTKSEFEVAGVLVYDFGNTLTQCLSAEQEEDGPWIFEIESNGNDIELSSGHGNLVCTSATFVESHATVNCARAEEDQGIRLRDLLEETCQVRPSFSSSTADTNEQKQQYLTNSSGDRNPRPDVEDTETKEDSGLVSERSSEIYEKEIMDLKSSQTQLQKLLRQEQQSNAESIRVIRNKVAELEAERQSLRPLVEVGVAIRKRFLDKERLSRPPHLPDQLKQSKRIVAIGNAGAHHGNGLADAALFKTGFLSAADEGYLKIYRSLYGFNSSSPSEYESLRTPRLIQLADYRVTIHGRLFGREKIRKAAVETIEELLVLRRSLS